MVDVVALLAGGFSGVLMGLTGAGGSLFAVPLLVFVLGVPMREAIPAALLAVALAGALGTLLGLRARLVRYRAAAWMAGVGLIVAPFGYALALRLPGSWLLLMFALVMLGVAARLFRGVPAVSIAGDEPVRRAVALNPDTGRFVWTPRSAATLAGVGATAGLLAGLLGVGGGFVIVPALRSVSALSMRSAVATSLMSLTLISAGGVLMMQFSGQLELPDQTTGFLAGAVLGLLLGRRLSERLPERRLQQFFAALMAVVGVSLLLRSQWHWFS